jgi:hypothetical protein
MLSILTHNTHTIDVIIISIFIDVIIGIDIIIISG